MATEVLRSQDRLAAEGFLHRRRNIHCMPSLIVTRRPCIFNSNGHRKKSDNKRIARKTPSPSPSPSPPNVAGPVILLRRGDSSDSLAKPDLNQSKKSPNFKPHDGSVGGGDHAKWKERKKSRSQGYRSCDDVSICGTRKESTARQIKSLPSPNDVYAGSGFCLSPSPRSLPLPSFFSSMKAAAVNGDVGSEAKAFEDSATSGLRRLLRLD